MKILFLLSLCKFLLSASLSAATVSIEPEFFDFLSGQEYLEYRCQEYKTHSDVTFINSEQRRNMAAIFAANLQNLGLEIASLGLAYHAYQLKKNITEFSNDIENILKTSCSANMTVKSFDLLKKQSLNLYQQFIDQKYPHFFSSSHLDSLQEEEKRQFHENSYFLSYLNYRDFCTWNGNGSDLRLLIQYLKEPLIAQFIIKHVTGEQGLPKEISNMLPTKYHHAFCSGFFCRNESFEIFVENFPNSMGSEGMLETSTKFYCQDLRYQELDFEHPNSKIRKWAREQTPITDSLKIINFISHLFSRPEFIFKSERMENASTSLVGILNSFYSVASEKKLSILKKDLLFEDHLTVNNIDEPNALNPLALRFDISFGQWDKAISYENKLKGYLDFKLPKKFIQYVKRQYQILSKQGNPYKLQKFKDEVYYRMKEHITILQKDMWITPWNDNLHEILAPVFISQVNSLTDSWLANQQDVINLPIELYYGPYALKYSAKRFKYRYLLRLDS